MSARSWRTLRLSVTRVRPPVPGSTPSSGTSGRRHRRRAVVDQKDLVARQRELVAAAGARAVHRGEELQPRMRGRVFETVARLVGELAEVHLPGMRREAEHEDVGARAEDAVLAAREDDRAHFGMLEADALDRVVQLDVDAEVVGVELQLVAGTDARVLVDVERQRGDRAVEGRASSACTAKDRCGSRPARQRSRAGDSMDGVLRNERSCNGIISALRSSRHYRACCPTPSSTFIAVAPIDAPSVGPQAAVSAWKRRVGRASAAVSKVRSALR